MPTGLQRAARKWPRARGPAAWGLLVSLAAHGLLAAALLGDAASRSRRAAHSASGTGSVAWLRLLPPSVRTPDAVAAPRSGVPPPATSRPRKARRPPAAANAAPPARAAPAAAPVAIDGAVFALPRIAYPSTAAPSPRAGDAIARAATAASAHGAAAAGYGITPPPEVAVQRGIEAARAQMMHAMQLELGRLPLPGDAGEGRCTPRTAQVPALSCDNAMLQRAVDARSAALAALLSAYGRVDAQAAGAAIEFRNGRYRLAAGTPVGAPPTTE